MKTNELLNNETYLKWLHAQGWDPKRLNDYVLRGLYLEFCRIPKVMNKLSDPVIISAN